MSRSYASRASGDDAQFVANMADKFIGGDLAKAETIARIQSLNGDSIWILRDVNDGVVTRAGFAAFLHLNQTGFDAFADGTFDFLNPAALHIAPEGERPAGTYVWAVVAPKRAQELLQLVMSTADAARYVDVPVLARGTTAAGGAAMQKMGFHDAGNGARSGARGVDSVTELLKARA
jgi:hypothetical protein